MGGDQNGRGPKWKTTKWKTTKIEDDKNGRRPKIVMVLFFIFLGSPRKYFAFLGPPKFKYGTVIYVKIDKNLRKNKILKIISGGN